MEQRSPIKTILHGAASFLPHLLMAFALMLLTFYVITLFNEAMEFLVSKLSRKFELVMAGTALLTAAAAFLQKQLRIPAGITAVCAIAYAIPVLLVMSREDFPFFYSVGFEWMSLVFSIVTLVFAVAKIAVQRRIPA